MVAISFSVFRDKIMNGTKRQTVRRHKPYRYNQFVRLVENYHEINRRWLSFGELNKSDLLQLYWKLRTKDTELLKEVPLKEVYLIKMDLASLSFLSEEFVPFMVISREEELNPVAVLDGFENWSEMGSWFRDKYGPSYVDNVYNLIRW